MTLSDNQRIWGTGTSCPKTKAELLAIQEEQQRNRDIKAKLLKEMRTIKPVAKVEHDYKKLREAADKLAEMQELKRINSELE